MGSIMRIGIVGLAESAGSRWAAEEAMDLDVPAPATTLALMARSASRQESSFAARVVTALPTEFGGQAARKADA